MDFNCIGTARILHSETGKIIEIPAEELSWDCTVSDHERVMGIENIHVAVLEHPILGTLRWEVYEYPHAYINEIYHELSGNRLIDDFQFGFKDNYIPENIYELGIEEPPENPATIYRDTSDGLTKLLNEKGDEENCLINRMVFTQTIASLEAYFSDTIIGHVMNSNTSIKKLISNDKILKNEKVTLEEINNNEGVVEKRVRLRLSKILYHNLRNVLSLYKTAVDIDIFEKLNDEDRKKLVEAIEYRHHCVHRNGFDKEGNAVTVFTKDYVTSISEICKGIVSHIEDNLPM